MYICTITAMKHRVKTFLKIFPSGSNKYLRTSLWGTSPIKGGKDYFAIGVWFYYETRVAPRPAQQGK